MEDISQYARLDVTRVGVERGSSWASLLARILLATPTLAAGFYKIFHLGPFVQTRMFFVVPLNGSGIPVWFRWLVGYPIPFVELIAGGLLLVGTQTRGALLAIAATIVVITLGGVVHDPLHEVPIQLLPRIGLLLYLLVMPQSGDRWSLDQWMQRRALAL